MKTAVIHSYNGMGDLIWHLPYIHAVARQAKENKVILFSKKTTNAHELLSADPYIEKIINLDDTRGIFTNLFSFFKISKSLKENNIEKISYFMDECKKQGIKVLGPQINESAHDFVVNKEKEILFGLGAIKGSGDAAVNYIIKERKINGIYKDVFDFICRTNSRAVNKKTYEALALAGAFDCFEKISRRQYTHAEESEKSLIEKAIVYANKIQKEKDTKQTSLFGGSNESDIPQPPIPNIKTFAFNNFSCPLIPISSKII